MPIILPTPDELSRLRPAQREKIRRAVWAILTESDRVAAREAAKAHELHAYGEHVREHARALEEHIPRDDSATILARRAVLVGKE
jgi:hypothetical protein